MPDRKRQQLPTVPWNPQRPTVAMPSGTMPIPLPQVPMWQPTFPSVSRQEGPNEGSGEGPATPPSSQQAPPSAQMPVPQGLMDRLRDPRFTGWLMTVGATLGQPRAVGQTGWGQAAQAMAQGYNFLAMQRQMQEARARQAWEDQQRVQDTQMKQDVAKAQIRASDAQTAQGDRSLDLKKEAQDAEILNQKERNAIEREYRDLTYGLSKEERDLKKAQAQTEIMQFEQKLKEMQAERKDTKAYRDAQIELEKAKVKLEAITANAVAADRYASARQAHASAADIEKNGLPRGGSSSSLPTDPAMLDASRYTNAVNSINDAVEQEALFNNWTSEQKEAEKARRVAPIKAAYDKAVASRDVRMGAGKDPAAGTPIIDAATGKGGQEQVRKTVRGVIPRSDLEAQAKQMGITYEAAKAQAEARGFVVR